MNCYRHPNAETFLRCGKCDRPICPDCTRIGPVGARCPDCAAIRSSPLFQVSGDRLALGAFAGLVAATVVGYLLCLLSGMGFFLLWGGLLGGYAIGEAVLRALNRKRGAKVEIVAGVSAALGLVLAWLLWYQLQGGAALDLPLVEALRARPYYLFTVAITIFSAISRVRFF